VDGFHSGQTLDACPVPAIILQKKTQTNVESFTLTVKLNAISENLSFLLRACVQNEVVIIIIIKMIIKIITIIIIIIIIIIMIIIFRLSEGHPQVLSARILFIGTFYVSFSYELRARKSLN